MTEKILTVKGIMTVVVFTGMLTLAVPATAHGGSHEDEPDQHEDEYTIKLLLKDSVTQETIIGDITAANKSIKNESVASFNVPKGRVKVSATAEGYSSSTDTIDVRRSGMMLSVQLEPKKQELEVTTVGSEGKPLKFDHITTSPEKVESSSTSKNTSVHKVEEAYQGYTYTVEAVSNGDVVVTEDVKIQDRDTELEILVSNQTESPNIDIDTESDLLAVVSSFFVLGIVGLIVLYIRKKR